CLNRHTPSLLCQPLTYFNQPTTKDPSPTPIAGAIKKNSASIGHETTLVVPPPPVQGLGTTGGFKLYLQDRGGRGYDDLAKVTNDVLTQARQQKELFPLATYTTFQNNVPQLYADVERVKAKRQGIPLSNIFNTLQTYLGSA